MEDNTSILRISDLGPQLHLLNPSEKRLDLCFINQLQEDACVPGVRNLVDYLGILTANVLLVLWISLELIALPPESA